MKEYKPYLVLPEMVKDVIYDIRNARSSIEILDYIRVKFETYPHRDICKVIFIIRNEEYNFDTCYIWFINDKKFVDHIKHCEQVALAPTVIVDV